MEPILIAKATEGGETLWQDGATRMLLGPYAEDPDFVARLHDEPVPFGWIENEDLSARRFVHNVDNILKTGMWLQVADVVREETLLVDRPSED